MPWEEPLLLFFLQLHLFFVLIQFPVSETAVFQSYFDRKQIVTPANEVYKCVNWTQNVNTQLAFF